MPEQVMTSLEDDEEKEGCVWWKVKKWASRIMHRLFERYFYELLPHIHWSISSYSFKGILGVVLFEAP